MVKSRRADEISGKRARFWSRNDNSLRWRYICHTHLLAVPRDFAEQRIWCSATNICYRSAILESVSCAQTTTGPASIVFLYTRRLIIFQLRVIVGLRHALSIRLVWLVWYWTFSNRTASICAPFSLCNRQFRTFQLLVSFLKWSRDCTWGCNWHVRWQICCCLFFRVDRSKEIRKCDDQV